MRPLFLAPPILSYPRTAVTVSAKYRPPRQPLDSSSNHRDRIPRNRQEEEEDGRGISGADVLRALQRAAARKKKVKQKKRELSPAEGRPGDKEGDIDLSEVRELQVKSEWSSRLDEFERLLRELDDTI